VAKVRPAACYEADRTVESRGTSSNPVIAAAAFLAGGEQHFGLSPLRLPYTGSNRASKLRSWLGPNTGYRKVVSGRTCICEMVVFGPVVSRMAKAQPRVAARVAERAAAQIPLRRSCCLVHVRVPCVIPAIPHLELMWSRPRLLQPGDVEGRDFATRSGITQSAGLVGLDGT